MLRLQRGPAQYSSERPPFCYLPSASAIGYLAIWLFAKRFPSLLTARRKISGSLLARASTNEPSTVITTSSAQTEALVGDSPASFARSVNASRQRLIASERLSR